MDRYRFSFCFFQFSTFLCPRRAFNCAGLASQTVRPALLIFPPRFTYRDSSTRGHYKLTFLATKYLRIKTGPLVFLDNLLCGL
jgi:hypothetical protein